mmetsp:Transcript_20681/g.25594  ORF Transcript_20681/g.25594 Transcript_20681/m.25594 type:complete len:417 (-) Transcript_20681:190-1440(-)|eukprot:CAMPEP_0172499638 /NCGR_PEP_ID=MMETSP1066-20121228/129037_1 /TAXON_ID=671091 /ORGANISM="Coscinodiscus wailesii, Strain CCMP2513" /LENGTH=416 /DNA_ID=CAMNT_0013273485 /DNA_START=145 /DNA_END=1395 /DNA_ORIENTATION=+
MSEIKSSSSIEDAITTADPYHNKGTSYLHTTPTSYPASGAVVTPISLATTFIQTTPGRPTNDADPNSFGLGYEYSRTGNPTRGAFERALAQAESAQYAVAFSSGSAATSAVIHLLQSGDEVLCVDDVYGGTQRYFRRVVGPRMNISFKFLDVNDLALLEANLKETKAKLLWLETPTNPTLRVSDISQCALLAKKYGCLLCVDNTFCSPYFQNPLVHGADIVVHSVTKYIGGHSDVVMGVVCANDEEIYKQLRFIQNGVGAVPSPFDCFLAQRGLKTLHVRMEAAARNAFAIALFLQDHDAVAKVVYPGLPSHPQHEIAKRQQLGYGAMITFYCKGGRDQSAIILQNLKIFALAESLGAVESLAECPSLMTHASVPSDQRQILGIDDTLIRLSVGIESCRDLVNDLKKALDAAALTL